MINMQSEDFFKILQSEELELALGINVMYLLLKTILYFHWNRFQSNKTMIPQFVGFHLQKTCKVRNFYALQSEEEDQFSSNSSDCRINGLPKLTKWGISLITSNLRKHSSVFILKWDSSDCSILLLEKHGKWGIFFTIQQSEEFAIFNAIRDSSDYKISNMIKATIWGRLWNQLLVSMSYRYWYKLFYTFVEVGL